MSVRVRFAPSPTGYLHVGGLRTALYNYLFARNQGGEFILRIEDTDRTRFVENATENLIKSLQWAGIEFDESPVNPGEYGPYVQSERLSIYKKYADELLNKGCAYYAFDTSEELTEMRNRLQADKKETKYDRMNMKNQLTLGEEETRRLICESVPYVVRLLVPDELIKFSDTIRGEIAVHGREIDDQILMKSDGYPTYHLANVVDDHLMKITNVIRGEEWLPSTPKHVILYNYFGWDLPEFAHLPLLLNKDKSKLSKRQGDVAVEDYIKKGYIRDAFVNFIALLGWNPSADREIYTMDELIELFHLEKVNKAGAVFDLVKLDWVQAYYLHHIVPVDQLVAELKTLLDKNSISDEYKQTEYLERVINLFRERIKFIEELPEMANYMFAEPRIFDEKYKAKHWNDDTEGLLREFSEFIAAIDDFTHDTLYPQVSEWIEAKGMKLKNIIHIVRLSITGKSSGAGMFETMELLGKERCINRINYFLENEI